MSQKTTEQKIDYENIIQTEEFKSLMKNKKRFATPYVIIFLLVFFALPVLTSYTSILEAQAIGWMTWTWVYSFGIFAMVWIMTSIYMTKAKEFDKDVEEIIKKHIVK